ncbi:hypothetical protein VN12_12585 [Pirellula sp. SH-Sr6A]|uniref:carboxypeptidase regulatory-like domain-containing protein n=1 Tax=Pirellula sp. SH-Sr6A TaxID=1632865 RepID=UPI00078E7159|nr:carboxypeptidase regulatory-like domain-containing protein [Pirellula sp. SH-Sr6A]AMV32957.1 hypothetical protein VN12_12585 [Pirellula sp. SH-Sr6A]
MNVFRCWSLVLIGLSLFASGCTSSDQPELGQVTGTITLDGKPLTGVAVVFQPENGRPARGMTNAEGKYELVYIRQTKGSKVGPNRVEIAPSEEGEESEEPEVGDGEAQTASKKSKSGKPVVPARYNTKSELKVEVVSGKNTFDFQLESK